MYIQDGLVSVFAYLPVAVNGAVFSLSSWSSSITLAAGSDRSIRISTGHPVTNKKCIQCGEPELVKYPIQISRANLKYSINLEKVAKQLLA